MGRVPGLRVRRVNDAPVNGGGTFVLYWMIAARRLRWNFALDRAVEHARELGKPLVVFEPLRCGYRWASDRLHRFILDGMAGHADAAAKTRSYLYFPYVEPEPGAGKGLLEALARRACMVVTDDFPAFFLPRMVQAAGGRLAVRLEAVDSNGLVPVRAAGRFFPTAYAFRRHLQKELPEHLGSIPRQRPFAGGGLPSLGALPAGILERWPAATAGLLHGEAESMDSIPIDHDVPPVDLRGGEEAGRKVLREFVSSRLDRYADDARQPDADGTSRLSPWLHFGHVAAHEVFVEVAGSEGWTPARIAPDADGRRSGWWGMRPAAESFLDQLVTWRELGFNGCAFRDDVDRYESLPDWARATLEAHAGDPRPYVYTRNEFESARTHDPLWNAAQNQLRREGRIHNYLRMLWGKKILEWSESPRAALQIMLALNDRWAVDGRDPNSLGGVFWILGRYDRAWGPERPVFGRVRYMSSASAERKLRVREFLKRYAPG